MTRKTNSWTFGWSAWIALLFAATLATTSTAAILRTSGAPRTTILTTPAGDTSRNISWSVVGDAPVPVIVPPAGLFVVGTPVVIDTQLSSPGGQIVIDRGAVSALGSLPPLAAKSSASGQFSERIEIREETIARARQAGARRILAVRTFVQVITVRANVVNANLTPFPPITRVFTDTRQEAVAFFLSPQVGGPLSIFRAVLRFDKGAPFRMVQPNEPVRVFADLFFRGTGRIEGVWEIADAASTSGNPVFRPLERVVRQLGAGQRLTLRGPALPNRHQGLYLVRFRLIGPSGLFEDPVVRYQVLAGGGPNAFKPIAVSGPPPRALVDRSTRFAWDEIQGAVVYRLELYEGERSQAPQPFDAEHERYEDLAGAGREPTPFEASSLDELGRDASQRGRFVTGLLLTSDEREAQLTELVWEELIPGRRYWWRVVALDEYGTTIATSESRQARVELPIAQPPAAP